MAQKTDLYSILTSYVVKHNNPYIETEPFIRLLEHHAVKNAAEYPEWGKWIRDTSKKFHSELNHLAEEGKCELLSDSPNGGSGPGDGIYMSGYILDLLREHYRIIDNNVENPFPGEDSLGFLVPDSQIIQLGAMSDLTAFIDDPPDPVPPIARISFPEDTVTALVLTNLIPGRLMESCMLKIRNYLRDYGNKDYIQNKLASQLMGKESALRDMLNRIILRPIDCCNTIAEGSDFPYLFWAHFCVFVRNDFKKKKEKTVNDTAVIQAVIITEAMNIFYKNKASKAKEKELAYRCLEQNLSRPPYIYTLEQIIGFKNPRGALLLGQYSREELAGQIKRLTNKSKEDKLPDLLVLAGPGNERFFIMKKKCCCCLPAW